MQHRTRDEHLFGPGPKRILALDGGGIRGILTLSFLKHLEDMLRARAGGDPDFRLSDYFDLIGGTSTGSIIATGLALGFPVEKLQQTYYDLGAQVFKGSFFKLGLLSAKFPEEPLIEALSREFGDHTLGSDELKTGLMIMSKRFDTGSSWVLFNNPQSKYFNPTHAGSTALPNRDFPLHEVVRASTAAPHYFKPERISVGRGEDAAFVDGGVSPFNNPSLQLFMLATLSGYGINWPVGPDKILLASFGTGYRRARLTPDEVFKMPAAQLAGQSLLSLMSDCDRLGQTMLQWFSDSPTAVSIDSEMGNLKDDLLGGHKFLSYLRYNVHFNSSWLQEHLGLELDEELVKSLMAMDKPKNLSILADLGTTAAQKLMKPEHFRSEFDLT
jgi:hypothetical protein